MNTENNCQLNKGVAYPQGFWAAGVYCGLKKDTSKLDLGAVVSSVECVASGVFTKNRFSAPSVGYSKDVIQNNVRGALVNSGNANAGTGRQGAVNVLEMARMGEEAFGLQPSTLLIAQTGVIGVQMDMNKIQNGIKKLNIMPCSSQDFSKAIITTDTVIKEYGIEIISQQGTYRIGGAAKGSGMIHPDMATMLAFFTTDAKVDKGFLDRVILECVDDTFNMITVDRDTSTNDCVFVLANGISGVVIEENTPEAEVFSAAMHEAFSNLSQQIVRDGEGASKFITVNVYGAKNKEQARMCARAVAASPLVKTAVHGEDPNWGRIIATAGYSGADLDIDRTCLSIGQTSIFENGTPLSQNMPQADIEMQKKDIVFNLYLNVGKEDATAWGCDLSHDYVTINSEYTT